jgi:hypothetical protein
MMNAFIFKQNRESEKENVFNVRKNFANISSFRDSSIMLFTTFNVYISFCNDRKIISFNYLIVSLCIIKTIRLLKEKKSWCAFIIKFAKKNRINEFS